MKTHHEIIAYFKIFLKDPLFTCIHFLCLLLFHAMFKYALLAFLFIIK